MRKTLGASALMLALCAPAYAGVILCPPVAPPPPNGMQAEQTTEGVMPNDEPDAFTEAVLSVVGSVLALL